MWLYIAVLSCLYIFVYTHTPFLILDAPHDDGLYIRLGMHLGNGEWLGPYGTVTLMKGPGYPFFLAAASWLGVPVSLAHALLHCASAAFFVGACHRFVGSQVISALLFTLLVWFPIYLIFMLLRVTRDAIYADQILILLGLLILGLFGSADGWRRFWFGIAAGLALGWIWLTREERIWLIPGLAILVTAALVQARRAGNLLAVLATLSIAAVAFGATQAGFQLRNKIAYGTFVGVDVKERNFQRALKALNSVTSGGTQYYVSVTKSARQQIYRVSPTFALLTQYFEGPEGHNWARYGCETTPSTCGEIGAGWFM